MVLEIILSSGRREILSTPPSQQCTGVVGYATPSFSISSSRRVGLETIPSNALNFPSSLGFPASTRPCFPSPESITIIYIS